MTINVTVARRAEETQGQSRIVDKMAFVTFVVHTELRIYCLMRCDVAESGTRPRHCVCILRLSIARPIFV
jgi:hypothetical protein